MDQIKLSDLPVQSCAMIEAIDVNLFQRKRLQDLGLIPQSIICCRHVAPSGSPVAFEVKGSIIALRSSDCDNITVSYVD